MDDYRETRAASRLRTALAGADTVIAPLCLTPLQARLTESLGFRAGYLSGGALGYELAVSEALLTLTELTEAARRITARSELPLIVDGGVGFGDPVHMVRTIREIEATGAAGIEIEDQVAPKRVSHHRGIEHLVSTGAMEDRIRAAVDARRDPDFVVVARTGAVRNESFEAAVERCLAYGDAGADLVMLMPSNDEEWAQAAQRVPVPVATIAAMDARSPDAWRSLGWRLVIDPFTAHTVAVDAMRAAHAAYQRDGDTGVPLARRFAVYREFSDLAGLGEFYELEDRTTERH
ncbi:MAG: isocitrate lyase/phosphoenolpyruvate mutase family protein [Gammaproteobacteria bacterium]|nr:isocitrate lyase/phosphoenolpyruvate mutase family protein [Gammaproteobacteria bacterium]